MPAVLSGVAALGAAVVAGVFLAFSRLVMPALARVAPASAVVVMRAINVAAIDRLFLGALFGVAAVCVVLLVASLQHWREPGAPLRLLGAAAYLLGVVGVTIACNVPRNNALAAVRPRDDGLALWPVYLREWTGWNHVRTIAGLAAAVLLLLACD